MNWNPNDPQRDLESTSRSTELLRVMGNLWECFNEHSIWMNLAKVP